jgi:replication factor C small subunit
MKKSEEVRNRLLVEKYKPKCIEDLLLEPKIKNKFLEFVKNNDCSNLLFSGHAGCGKTSSANIIGNSISDNVLFLNASSETGVDTVRNKIQVFCASKSISLDDDGKGDLKIVILDEVDGSSTQFQYALKENIEKFYGTTRFIFTSNNPHNIDPAIRSRCTEFEFGNIDRKLIAKRLIEILKNEKIKFDKENVVNIIKGIGTDMRKLLNTIQQLTIDGELTKFVSSNEKHLNILNMLKNEELTKIRKYISEEGINYDGLIKYLFNNVKEISSDNWTTLMVDLSEVATKIKIGVDPDIAFSAGLVTIMEDK